MKVLAITLLCVVAAVQGRSAAVKNSEVILPERGDVPQLVGIRVAIGTSGLLESGLGSILASNWVLVAASTVNDSRFIWIRYNPLVYYSPSLVLESNNVIRNTDVNVAVINTGRHVEFTDSYGPIRSFALVPIDNVIFYSFGQDESGRPGERLKGSEVALTKNGDLYYGSSAAGLITDTDIGAPLLLEDGRQSAVLTSVDNDGVGTFTPSELFISWIADVTDIGLESQGEDEK